MTLDTSLLMLLVAVVVFGLGLALIALRRASSAGVRILVLALFAGLGTAAAVGGERILGNARPVGLDMVRGRDEARVVYAHAVRGVGIFLLVSPGEIPVYYRLPWQEGTAKQLRDALEEAERGQATLMFRFEPSLERREPRFYAMPPPPMPDKTPPEPGIEYRSREWDA